MGSCAYEPDSDDASETKTLETRPLKGVSAHGKRYKSRRRTRLHDTAEGRKKSPRWRRSKRAITEIREYLGQHLDAEPDMVKLDRSINERIWERGSRNPPSRIIVRAMKFEDGVVEAELAAES